MTGITAYLSLDEIAKP